MIKVATYCRVSTDRDDQANSFESQQKYFADYIERQAEWELYRVYADEGITGTSTKKRVEFNHMIRDARAGKFSLILTKEVSRFSRNILDTISFTRELRALGVGVLFMNDGINTLDPDAELRLSIMGSIAQEESRKTSSRVKWGQTRQMEKGVVFGRSMIGYDVEGGKMTINPEGADIVRLIFHKYGREKKGTSIIARELREAGYRSYRGDVHWTNTQILRILRNEKYVGDLVQKKTITPDYLTHEKKYNHGEEQMVVIKNHHEPIIDRELWDIVQAELERRNNHGKYGVGHANRYVFSGKIKCGACGERYVSNRRVRKSGRVDKRWACYNTRQHGKKHIDKQGNEVGCDIAVVLPDDLAMDMMKKTVTSLRHDKGKIIERLTTLVMQVLTDAKENTPTERIEDLEAQIATIKKKKETLLDEYLSLTISKSDMILMNKRYDTEIADLEKRIERTKEQAELLDEEGIRRDIAQNISTILAGDTTSEAFYKNLLREMVVYPENVVEIELNLLPMKWVYLLDSFNDTAKMQSDVENLQQEVARKMTQNDTPLGTCVSSCVMPLKNPRSYAIFTFRQKTAISQFCNNPRQKRANLACQSFAVFARIKESKIHKTSQKIALIYGMIYIQKRN